MAAGAWSRHVRPVRLRLARWARRAVSMSGAEWAIFISAALVNPIMLGVLRVRGTRAAVGMVRRASARPLATRRRPITDDTITEAKRASAWVNRGAAWPMPSVTCLARSLTGQLLLQRRGIETVLKIGVGPADEELGGSPSLQFHAWLEVGGVPVNDVLDIGEQFLPFPLEQGLTAIGSRQVS